MAVGQINDEGDLKRWLEQQLGTAPEVQQQLISRVADIEAHEFSGTGSPEGVVEGSRGDRYRRVDGGAGTSLYVKESGDGTNTGWVAK